MRAGDRSGYPPHRSASLPPARKHMRDPNDHPDPDAARTGRFDE